MLKKRKPKFKLGDVVDVARANYFGHLEDVRILGKVTKVIDNQFSIIYMIKVKGYRREISLEENHLIMDTLETIKSMKKL